MTYALDRNLVEMKARVPKYHRSQDLNVAAKELDSTALIARHVSNFNNSNLIFVILTLYNEYCDIICSLHIESE